MFARRTDLQLDADVLGRFLPWVIAFMVFLAILAAAGMLVVEHATETWRAGVSSTLTIQLPPPAVDEAGNAPAAAEDPRAQEALRILHGTPGVKRAEVIPDAEIAEMLEPWLGGGLVTGDLPLPRLIDVETETDVDLTALRQSLAKADPEVQVDDHRVWLNKLVRLADTIEILATAVLVLIGLATVGTVVYTTWTGLAVHREAIEVLHLIGAHDSYVARQFAWRALDLGLRGGIIGLVLAVPVLLLIGYLGANLESGLLPAVSLDRGDWALLVLIPAAVALVTMFTARMTVMRTLSRML